MKLVGRTLIILLATLVVIGTTMAFAQSSYAHTLVPTLPAGIRGDAPANFNSAEDNRGTNTMMTTGRPNFSEGRTRPAGGNAMNIFAIMDLVKNLGIMGAMVALVVLVPAGVRRFSTRWQQASPHNSSRQ